MTKRITRYGTGKYRVCAICHKRHAHTYGFHTLLARYGIAGDKAAISCVRKLQKLKAEDREKVVAFLRNLRA